MINTGYDIMTRLPKKEMEIIKSYKSLHCDLQIVKFNLILGLYDPSISLDADLTSN